MNSQDFRNLQEAYLDVYDEGYKSFPDEKVRAKAKKLAPNRDDLGRQALDAKQADTTPEKDLNRARKLRLIARTHTSTGPEQVEKRNKGPESLLYKKRSKLVSDNTKKKSFPNRLRRSDGQGISDSYDYYDIILSHLLDEGYADTEEAAERIMVNMSEEWRESIVEQGLDPDAPGNTHSLADLHNALKKYEDKKNAAKSPKPGGSGSAGKVKENNK